MTRDSRPTVGSRLASTVIAFAAVLAFVIAFADSIGIYELLILAALLVAALLVIWVGPMMRRHPD
jgi:hypothetical protein